LVCYRTGFNKKEYIVNGVDQIIEQYNSLKSFEFGKKIVGDLLKMRLGKYITNDIMTYIVGKDTMDLEREEYGGPPHEIFIVKNPTQKKQKWNYQKIGAVATGLLAVGFGLKRMCF